jgi:hypothetical protein
MAETVEQQLARVLRERDDLRRVWEHAKARGDRWRAMTHDEWGRYPKRMAATCRLVIAGRATVPEAAAIQGVSTSTVYKWVRLVKAEAAAGGA